MIDYNNELKDVMDLYRAGNYINAAQIMRNLLTTSESNNPVLKIDAAHLSCLAGDYDKALPLLEEIISETKENKANRRILGKAYIAYSNCLFHKHDYIRSYYYLMQYKRICDDCSFVRHDALV